MGRCHTPCRWENVLEGMAYKNIILVAILIQVVTNTSFITKKTMQNSSVF